MATTIDDPNHGANKARAGIRPMSLVKWAVIGLLALPPAELAAFLLAAAMIGWLWATALFIASSVVGIALLRRTARIDLERLRHAIAAEGLRGIHLDTPGMATMLGGILLACPGFITDLLGAALLLPGFPRWLSERLALAARRRREARRDPRIIDLEPGEWRQISDQRQGRQPKSRSSSSRATSKRRA
jgi:UPF0716 protein FxsA